jgi:hypothetical protein
VDLVRAARPKPHARLVRRDSSCSRRSMNLIFVAPALAFQIACSRPSAQAPSPPSASPARRGSGVIVYAIALGPPNLTVSSPPIGAIDHPPKHGRIVAYGPARTCSARPTRWSSTAGSKLHRGRAARQLRPSHGSLADPTPAVRRSTPARSSPTSRGDRPPEWVRAKDSGPYGTYLSASNQDSDSGLVALLAGGCMFADRCASPARTCGSVGADALGGTISEAAGGQAR